jgi:hypothetical protein
MLAGGPLGRYAARMKQKRGLLLGLLAVVVVLGGVALVFREEIALAFASREAKACVKIGKLCGGGKGSLDQLEACEDGIGTARKLAGEKAVEKSLACIEETDTCVGASGCMVGGVGAGALIEFGKGVGNALGK